MYIFIYVLILAERNGLYSTFKATGPFSGASGEVSEEQMERRSSESFSQHRRALPHTATLLYYISLFSGLGNIKHRYMLSTQKYYQLRSMISSEIQIFVGRLLEPLHFIFKFTFITPQGPHFSFTKVSSALDRGGQ